MKVIFVGIHNKPGKEPLCSTTKTGSIVDLIISRIGNIEVEKKNLFPVDYMPGKKEADQLAASFKIEEDALYIGLGKVVNDFIGFLLHPNFISVPHPGYVQRKGKELVEQYISYVVKRIVSNIDIYA